MPSAGETREAVGQIGRDPGLRPRRKNSPRFEYAVRSWTSASDSSHPKVEEYQVRTGVRAQVGRGMEFTKPHVLDKVRQGKRR